MQQINLDLVPSGVPPVVYASQYDVGRIFRINLFDGNDAYIVPDGAVVTLVGTKTDMHSFAYSSEDDDPKVKVDGSSITVTTTEQMCAMPDNALCEISVRKSTTLIIGSLNFILHVEKAVVPDDANSSASDLSAYESIVSHIQEAHQDVLEINKFLDEMAQFNESLSQTHKVTLKADKWQGIEAPYSYKLGDFDDVIVNMIFDAETITEDQIVAAQDACIIGGIGSTIYAYKKKPTVDIPVVIGYTSFIRKETS